MDEPVTELAVLNGGPMDGREHSFDGDAVQLCVVMTDGQQHRYSRTEQTQMLEDGRAARVFEYRGRFYGRE